MQNLIRSDDGVVGVVATIMVVGLILVAISTVQSVYIPHWMKETKASHMDIVANQFSQLKTVVDTQTAIKQPKLPISTAITLGTKELPILVSSRSYGSLQIVPDEFEIIIRAESETPVSYSIGGIRYSSGNTCYLNQDYVFEAGSIILNQTQGNVMITKPMFSVNYTMDDYTENNMYAVAFAVINISTSGNQNDIGGYGTYPIQTEFSESKPTTRFDSPLDIIIKTRYVNAWHKFLNNTFMFLGLKYDSDYSIDVYDNSLVFHYLETDLFINLNIIEINTQISHMGS